MGPKSRGGGGVVQNVARFDLSKLRGRRYWRGRALQRQSSCPKVAEKLPPAIPPKSVIAPMLTRSFQSAVEKLLQEPRFNERLRCLVDSGQGSA